MGFLIGMGIQVIIALTIIYRFDWDQESLKVMQSIIYTVSRRNLLHKIQFLLHIVVFLLLKDM